MTDQVLNTDDSHSNRNDNTNRPYEGECCADRVRENTHDKPNPAATAIMAMKPNRNLHFLFIIFIHCYFRSMNEF